MKPTKPPIKKPYVIAIIFMLGMSLGCGSGVIATAISGGAEIALELTMPAVIENSINKDANAPNSWRIVANSIDNQLLPLINRGTITTGDLKAWFNLFKVNANEKPISKQVIDSITKIGDGFLRLIPTDPLGNLIDSDPIASQVMKVIKSLMITFRDIIYSEIGAPTSRSLGKL